MEPAVDDARRTGVTHRWRVGAIVLAGPLLSALVGVVIVLQDGPHICSYPALCRLRPDGTCAPNPPCPDSGYRWWWVAAAAVSGATVVALLLLATSRGCRRED